MQQMNLLHSALTDEELFTRFKEDDTAAFKEIYVRHWTGLVNAAYKRLDSVQKAEDIVQNIFVDLYQRRADITLSHALSGYLHQALKYKILNELRAESTRAKYYRKVFFYDVCKNVLAESIEAKELSAKLHRVIEELPDKCREVFLLSRREEKSNNDISRDLNISVSTVEKHIGKALKTLKCHIQLN